MYTYVYVYINPLRPRWDIRPQRSFSIWTCPVQHVATYTYTYTYTYTCIVYVFDFAYKTCNEIMVTTGLVHSCIIYIYSNHRPTKLYVSTYL